MDDTQLQNALDELLRLYTRADSRLTRIEQRLTTMEATMPTAMATRKDVAGIIHALTHYGKHVEGMWNDFAKTPAAAQ